MSFAPTLFLAGFVYGALVMLVIGVCVSGADADRLDRILGPGSSSTDLQLGLMVALDEANSPPAERRCRP